jgi:hypothetical protein
MLLTPTFTRLVTHTTHANILVTNAVGQEALSGRSARGFGAISCKAAVLGSLATRIALANSPVTNAVGPKTLSVGRRGRFVQIQRRSSLTLSWRTFETPD